MEMKSSWRVRWRWRWRWKGLRGKRRTALACLAPRVRVREGHLLLFDNGRQASPGRYTEAGLAHRGRSRSPTLILQATTAIELGHSSSLRGEGRPDHLPLRRGQALGPGEVRYLLSASGILGATLAVVGYPMVSPESKRLVEAFLGGTRTRRRETKCQRFPHCREFVSRQGADQSNWYLRGLELAPNLVRVRYPPNGRSRR